MDRPSSPSLIDPAARHRALSRAHRLGREDIIHRIVASEIEDRLDEVNRRFTAPAIITDFPEFWSAWWPEAVIVAPEERLALSEAAHDLVIHALALHWAEDPVGQMIQARHALVPDGLFIAAFPSGDTLVELRHVLRETEATLSSALAQRLLPMGELRDLGALLGRAGLALPVADHLRQTLSYRDIFHLIADLRAMGETNALNARPRTPPPRAFFAYANAAYARNWPDPDNPARIRATLDLTFLTGWAPHPDQQKPLEPGSAVMRLADALNPTRTE